MFAEPELEIDAQLLAIRMRRLSWIVSDALSVVEHFAESSLLLKTQFKNLLLAIQKSIDHVKDTPLIDAQLFAKTQAVERWQKGEKDFLNQIKILSSCVDEGDRKATELIVADVQACYASGLELTWIEKQQAERWDQFEQLVVRLAGDLSTVAKPIHCFISYAWGVPTHEQWVHEFAQRLKRIGVTVSLDIWDNLYGSINKFTEKINQADYIIVVGTPKLKQKWENDDFPHVIKQELEQIIRVAYKTPNKLIKLILAGNNEESFPESLVAYACGATDFSEEKYYFERFFNLLVKIYESSADCLSLIKAQRSSWELTVKQLIQQYQPVQNAKQQLQQYYQEHSHIKRLFYPVELPIESNYINLSIVHESDHRTQERAFARRDDSNHERQLFEDLYNPQKKVQVADIFKKNNASLIRKTATRVLITGIAGVGKTTLSQYLTWVWASSAEQIQSSEKPGLEAFDAWREQFSFVFCVKLRLLMQEAYQNQRSLTAIDILIDQLKIAQQSYQGESALITINQADIPALKRLLELEEKSGHVLILIDGYDEVAKSLPPHLENVLKQLLNARHVILTSRPYYLDDLVKKYRFVSQVHYRVTGFTDENIQSYIQSFFEYMIPPKELAKQSLQQFLQKHLSLRGPCHVPINLELVCSAWDQQPFSDQSLTLTELYHKVVLSLLRRYLEKKGEDISCHSDEDILLACEKELFFLEYFAFSSLYQNKMVAKLTEAIKAMKNEFSLCGSSNPENINAGIKFIAALLECGFINSITEGNYEAEKEYYFPHRTFQEYFAARFFVRCWQKNTPLLHIPSATKYLCDNRFNSNLEILWWFVAGLLYGETSHLLRVFFESILQNHAYAISSYQAGLLIRCWDESHASLLISDKLIKNTLAWFKLLLNETSECLQTLQERVQLSAFVCNIDAVEEFIRAQHGSHSRGQFAQDRLNKFPVKAGLKYIAPDKIRMRFSISQDEMNEMNIILKHESLRKQNFEFSYLISMMTHIEEYLRSKNEGLLSRIVTSLIKENKTLTIEDNHVVLWSKDKHRSENKFNSAVEAQNFINKLTNTFIEIYELDTPCDTASIEAVQENQNSTHLEMAAAWLQLGRLHRQQNKWVESKDYLERAWTIIKTEQGETHSEALEIWNELEQARQMCLLYGSNETSLSAHPSVFFNEQNRAQEPVVGREPPISEDYFTV